MFNPVKAVGGFMSGVKKLGEATGKAQKMFTALTADVDGDGTPEYKEASTGVLKMYNKFKGETVPLCKQGFAKAKQHLGEFATIFKTEIFPNVLSVFNEARKAALDAKE
jgi:hypothetical protein